MVTTTSPASGSLSILSKVSLVWPPSSWSWQSSPKELFLVVNCTFLISSIPSPLRINLNSSPLYTVMPPELIYLLELVILGKLR